MKPFDSATNTAQNVNSLHIRTILFLLIILLCFEYSLALWTDTDIKKGLL